MISTSPSVEQGTRAVAAGIILCADDFAMSDGVSRGIEALAKARRLSATSALVTLPSWDEAGGATGTTQAMRLARLRPALAIGLHVNLTLGAPLGAMPSLAPDGRLPPVGLLTRWALARRLDAGEVAAEIDRQWSRFEAATGHAPDFVDGHQHVHTLPIVRDALLRVLGRRCDAAGRPRRSLLVRDPADAVWAIVVRGASIAKSLVIAWLSAGFGRLVRRAGFITNDGFSGVSGFEVEVPYRRELDRFLSRPGPRHLVMCHPGDPDAELARLDPHTERRRQEMDAIMRADGLEAAIWHVDRNATSGVSVWDRAEARP